MKSAREWGITPLEMLTGKPGTWADERNRALALGLTQHEASICSGCGLSLVDTTADDAAIHADSRNCRGCQMLHDAKGEHDKPGTQYYLDVVD